MNGLGGKALVFAIGILLISACSTDVGQSDEVPSESATNPELSTSSERSDPIRATVVQTYQGQAIH